MFVGTVLDLLFSRLYLSLSDTLSWRQNERKKHGQNITGSAGHSVTTETTSDSLDSLRRGNQAG